MFLVFTEGFGRRIGHPTGMVAGDALKGFQSVVDDWTEGSPSALRRQASTEGVATDRNMREVSARLRPRFIDRAQISIEKRASFARVQQDSRARFGIWHGVNPNDRFRYHANMRGNSLDLLFGDRNHRVATAIGA